MRFYHSGIPIAKQRHRIARGIAYDPQTKQKRGMKFEFANQFRSQGCLNRLQGAIKAQVNISYPIPKSWSKKRQRNSLDKLVTSKPDLDNYEKFYFDVLNEIAYHDDSQVASIQSQKRYSNKPGVEILLFQMEDHMVNEHAVTYKEKLSVEDIDYIVRKANQLGLSNRQVIRVYQEEDKDGTHLYFVAENMKENGNGNK